MRDEIAASGAEPDDARRTQSQTASNGSPGTTARPAPLLTLCAITAINSLGTGLLWSGVYFVTEQSFSWTRAQNFMLALAATIVYAGAAFLSGPLVKAIDARVSTRRLLAILLLLQMASAGLSLLGPWGVTACALTASGTSAMLWPIVESYLSSGRHGHALRRAIGYFNLVWMGAVGLGLLLIAPMLAAGQAVYGMLLIVPIAGASIALLPWLPSRPPPHGAHPDDTDAMQSPNAAEVSALAPAATSASDLAPAMAHPYLVAETAARRTPPHRHRTDHERALRDATRVLLPVGYILIGAIGPSLPYLLGKLDVEPGWSTPVAAIWMVARLLTVALLIRSAFWHGRASAIVFGFALATGGFAVIALTTSLPVMIVGLSCFGAGQAIVYSAALYYAMTVGGAEVHAAGKFEMLIGLGYGVGPAVGLVVGSGHAYVWGVLGISLAITATAFVRIALARRTRT